MAGPRNLLAQNQSVQNAQGIGIYIIGWIALILAIVAGGYAANSWPGKAIRWVFELFPAWIIQLTLVIGFVVWAIDIIKDLTPNRPAITYGFMGPILAGSSDATGTLADRVRDWSDVLRGHLGDTLGTWVGNVGPGPLSIALMAVAVIVGGRVLAGQQRAGGGGMGGGR